MTEALFKDREEWSQWLKHNGSSQTELWMVYYKKHTGKTSITYEDAVEEALCFGWIDGKVQRIDEEKYRQRYTPRRPQSIWSETNRKRAEKMMLEGRMQPEGMKTIEIAKKNGMWEKAYPSVKKEPLKISGDIISAIEKDINAKSFFDSLAPSGKQMYVYWIESAKRKETRKNRINKMIDRCRNGIKPGML